MDVRVTQLCGACGKTFAKWVPEGQEPKDKYDICDPCTEYIEQDNADKWAVTFQRVGESIKDPVQREIWQGKTDEQKKATIGRLMAAGKIKVTIKDGSEETDTTEA